MQEAGQEAGEELRFVLTLQFVRMHLKGAAMRGRSSPRWVTNRELAHFVDAQAPRLKDSPLVLVGQLLFAIC